MPSDAAAVAASVGAKTASTRTCAEYGSRYCLFNTTCMHHGDDPLAPRPLSVWLLSLLLCLHYLHISLIAPAARVCAHPGAATFKFAAALMQLPLQRKAPGEPHQEVSCRKSLPQLPVAVAPLAGPQKGPS